MRDYSVMGIKKGFIIIKLETLRNFAYDYYKTKIYEFTQHAKY